MGHQTVLLKDDEVRKTPSTFKMGYEIFSNCAKLSPALVPRIKNNRFLSYWIRYCKMSLLILREQWPFKRQAFFDSRDI